MPEKPLYYLGIDLGSVSLNLVVLDGQRQVRTAVYHRTAGRPLSVLLQCFEDLAPSFHAFEGVVVTGSGRKMLGSLLGVPDINEIVTQAAAACHFHPQVRTIVEIGGQDSKLIFVDRHDKSGEPFVVDHVLNEVCAAGTGSFLDLQAQRLGIPIETMGPLALKGRHPARISGRCSVFAKSDMVHLLQEGTPKPDIVAGLCKALALNFITNLGKGKPFFEPIVFQGGVAANAGVVRAFEACLGLEAGSLLIPEHFLVMGAFGSALMARTGAGTGAKSLGGMIDDVKRAVGAETAAGNNGRLAPLGCRPGGMETTDQYYEPARDKETDVYLGIDMGAVSTNLVLVDRQGTLVAKQYRYTRGELVETVREGLEEMARNVGDRVRVCGVGVTGSGRYFVGDFVGADVVINEISAQARGAIHFEPEVDTIIEIGGQDSKFIRCRDGRVIDFEMNKVCAAGTGSFLEEQAERLKIPVRDAFSELAFSSRGPANLGARCTVFMESDLVHYQQTGQSIRDLAAGLAYAIAQNYLEKVVGSKKTGRRILFQGGVAGNPSVAAAFENLLGVPIAIPKHHNVTGAVGAALAARDRVGGTTRFAGFHLKERPYALKPFECEKCPNRCRVHRIYVEGDLRSCHGGLCGRYERSFQSREVEGLPDLFAERDEQLLAGWQGGDGGPGKKAGPVMGMPRAMGFFDRFPFWQAFFSRLGYQVVLSEETNKSLVEKGLPHVPSETCFPVKAVYGHMIDLAQKGADRVFLPCEVDHPGKDGDSTRSFNCPYVQSLPFMVRAAMRSAVAIVAPLVRWSDGPRRVNEALKRFAGGLGHGPTETAKALEAAWYAQNRFDGWRAQRGREVLGAMGSGDKALVLLGKTHNIYDRGLNLHLPGKLRREGAFVIPFDMLPLDTVSLPSKYDNVVWDNSRQLLKALFWMKNDSRFSPVLLTNFGCGPDSFFMKYMESEYDGPSLTLEVDDHTGDAGMVTRLEAFVDTLHTEGPETSKVSPPLNLVVRGKARCVDPWGPDPDLLRRLEGRTLYFPFVSRAFCLPVESAFKGIGLNVRILPAPDDDTEYLGRQVTSGRECHPFVVTCGEFVKLTRSPGFDPARAAVIMQNYDGACRFSQYGIGHADLFQRLGFPEIPVVAPLTSTRSDEFSRLFGLRFTRLLWQGWMAAEVLDRIRLHVRPYERQPGGTDRAYGQGIEWVADAVAKDDGSRSLWSRRILNALQRAAEALAAVPVDRSIQRPVVGIVGEFYTVLNRWANRDVVKTLERLGAEVRLHGLCVPNFYTLFSEHYYARRALKDKKPVSALYYTLRNRWVMSWVKRVEAVLPPALESAGTVRASEIIRETAPFVHYDIDPVPATMTARVRRFAATGVSGICNLYVLNCMLGNVSVPVFKNALRDFPRLPVLHASYDGQAGTNMMTRIEAFMHQVTQYAERVQGGGFRVKSLFHDGNQVC